MRVLGVRCGHPRLRFLVTSVNRRGTHAAATSAHHGDPLPLIQIPKHSSVYAFGAANERSSPLFQTKDVEWTVSGAAGESWGIVGRGKRNVFQTLLGHTRIHPVPQKGLFPIMRDTDPFPNIKFVPFRHSNAVGPGDSGGFYDYTARYGALWEGDDKTLGESVRESAHTSPLSLQQRDAIMESLGLRELLDVPRIALSNGQMRRARIMKALFKNPRLLMLDEPLTGLDVISRRRFVELLEMLKKVPSAPRIITSYRLQEIVEFGDGAARDVAPEFLTHILFHEGDKFWAGTRREFFNDFVPQHLELGQRRGDTIDAATNNAGAGRTVVHLKDVNVKYGTRKVLDGINWEIRQGDRWHLQGGNGSGKTTLLSLLTGDHPQSYVQKHLLLPSPESTSAPVNQSTVTQPAWKLEHRKRTPTPYLQYLVGVLSPELFDAFPRRYPGMSVWDAVQTGFRGSFIALNKPVGDVHVDPWEADAACLKEWRIRRCWEVLEGLGPASWNGSSSSSSKPQGQEETVTRESPLKISTVTREFAAMSFTSLNPGEQRMVLLMRALVGRPLLLILDEVWSGMEEKMIEAARFHLDGLNGLGADQAVILVTHWDSEVPWTPEHGLKMFRLEEGSGRIIS
ncbi:P-loop containing nucleoside triphosphate hydrolase protein [Coprinopsis marcescibilis]|uniref:P-loop containing nucleoside triphosphate hydrolase protein n=1 Tax=Coprinopsis marcescibilis TaxID=230819 RepID=A0A5C3KZ39_COPMA|nr:P-loop containing nucleoside triphosphate hydrolase protein [Coprinopsis marcescibilis]